MKKYIALLFLAVAITGCKTKAVISEQKATEDLSTQSIIESHYSNKKDFSTLYIRANADYKTKKESLGLTADIRIKKDEVILVSIRFFGVTMAKALITPTEVKYFEKMGKKYFEGDYKMLSNWLGTDLDFYKVQNMLIGKAIDDLRKGKYSNVIEEQWYRLDDLSHSETKKTFFFEAANFLIKKQVISQPKQDRTLQVLYPNHKEYKEAIIPLNVEIQAIQNNDETRISLQYNQVTFNEDLSFPYSVPSDYERIQIK
jgi:hypothetical protein